MADYRHMAAVIGRSRNTFAAATIAATAVGISLAIFWYEYGKLAWDNHNPNLEAQISVDEYRRLVDSCGSTVCGTPFEENPYCMASVDQRSDIIHSDYYELLTPAQEAVIYHADRIRERNYIHSLEMTAGFSVEGTSRCGMPIEYIGGVKAVSQ